MAKQKMKPGDHFICVGSVNHFLIREGEELPGFLFLREENEEWIVTEGRTGMKVTQGLTREEVLEHLDQARPMIAAAVQKWLKKEGVKAAPWPKGSGPSLFIAEVEA